jgi:hypothetical protein
VAQHDLGPNLSNLPNQKPSQLLVCLQLAVRQPEVDDVREAQDLCRSRLLSSSHPHDVVDPASTAPATRAHGEVYLCAASRQRSQRSTGEEFRIIGVGTHHQEPSEL